MDKKGKIALIAALVLVAFLVVAFVIAAPKSARAPRAVKACKDGIDNDGDGYIDLNDPGCANKNDKTETNSAIECDDGTDNDGDSAVDYNDGGCSGPTDDDESNCGDGVCEGGETSGNCPTDCGEPDSCADTDGGNVITTFGTTSGYLNNNPYSNDDYCVDAGNVMEYYCSGDYEQSSEQSCGTDSYGSPYCSAGDTIYKDLTDYFCASGECDSSVTPEFQEDCDDQDNYGANYCMNSSVYKDFNNYYCTGGVCDYTVTPELVEECNYGCTAGECDGVPDSCTDTDGWDVETQGTTSGYLNEQYYSNTDFCNGTIVIEFYCNGDYEYSYPLDCTTNVTTTCSNGACV